MQCSCGASAKLNLQETFYVCEACNRVSRKDKGEGLFALFEPVMTIEEKTALYQKAVALRSQEKYSTMHIHDIIEAIR